MQTKKFKTMEEVFVIMVVFSAIFGVIYVAVSAWNRQRIAMIEAGINPVRKRRNRKHSRLRIAMLLTCIPTGILIGNVIHPLFNLDAEEAAILFAFLFGGLALIATYVIEEKKSNPLEEE